MIYQFNGATGAQISTFSASTSYNIRAMTISNNTLYYSEIFQDRVRKFDLTQTPPTGGTFFTDSTHLNDSWNMTAGFNNVLVFANRADTKLQEYNATTGNYVGMLADLDNFNPSLTQSWDVTYNALLNNYFVSAGSQIFRLDNQGDLLQTYSSSLLQGASGVLAVPEPACGANDTGRLRAIYIETETARLLANGSGDNAGPRGRQKLFKVPEKTLT